ncbi:MAG: HAD family hydrolase [Chloroflexi bacterium]|nr:HAD family hydrolase [Chloroflexota bacterium]
MIRAVLFDVYGTIAGFSPSRYQLQRKACAAFGLGDKITPEGILKGYASADAFMTAENASRPLRLRDKEGRDEFFAEYERLVLKGCGIDVAPDLALLIFDHLKDAPSALTPFDDVVPTLVELRERGLTLGLISNMNMSGVDLLSDLGLSNHVDFAVTSLEARVEKPHPLAFQTALSRAGVEANEAIMVGDQPSSDIVGAAQVGIAPVLIDRDGNYPRYDACPRITTLDQLPPLIE